jgi:hypothetical protein
MMIIHRSKFNAEAERVTKNLQSICTKGHLKMYLTRNKAIQKDNNKINSVRQGKATEAYTQCNMQSMVK